MDPVVQSLHIRHPQFKIEPSFLFHHTYGEGLHLIRKLMFLQIKQEMECIKNAKIGDVHSPLGRPAVASSHVDDYFNQAIT